MQVALHPNKSKFDSLLFIFDNIFNYICNVFFYLLCLLVVAVATRKEDILKDWQWLQTNINMADEKAEEVDKLNFVISKISSLAIDSNIYVVDSTGENITQSSLP